MNWKAREDFLIEKISSSPEETFTFGQHIAALLSPGSVIALNGVLGSGKTCLAKGIACGLGISENLTSPTYTIINEYQYGESSNILYHIDAYRLKNDRDFEDIGGTEIISSDGISIIEWSERIPNSLPANAITVTLEITEHSSRLIRMKLPEEP